MSEKEDAFYAYKLKADSGYESESRGRISSARHGVVCAALSGALPDDSALLKAAPELLEALEAITDLYDTDEGCKSMPEYRAARAAIAKARGN